MCSLRSTSKRARAELTILEESFCFARRSRSTCGDAGSERNLLGIPSKLVRIGVKEWRRGVGGQRRTASAARDATILARRSFFT
jgi:hypothetical protein